MHQSRSLTTAVESSALLREAPSRPFFASVLGHFIARRWLSGVTVAQQVKHGFKAHRDATSARLFVLAVWISCGVLQFIPTSKDTRVKRYASRIALH